ncbi:Cysteinyl-tRNA synthetase [Liberibacter crescens BT-1]|uniref:Cysteine--tRNA ligase n=1 Tax=Liberibacter crescens (strain BT-1) TaxID=1215343 RepID=L0ES28_LIBCB|nr:cysteine--tRNA ligase [Liberibacter crescens]AGA64304.1 Cysteinyl-tRNA synthetase [Liberibacter crescens BT-1]AMC12518.1 cysteine--tRNA ligase [Liberibacter crescens]
MHERLKLYNTLTREKSEFQPIDPKSIKMYVCGPTVYDFIHIGNGRPIVVFDTLYRLLQHIYGIKSVTYVRNITDVDDKINARALQDYPSIPINDSIRILTKKNENQFFKDTIELGCLEPTYQPRATEHIVQMIDTIKLLLLRGHAYEANGEILFDVSSDPNYGQLSKRKLYSQKTKARVLAEKHKKNPADFVLWKLSSEKEPSWQSPWGKGRPGWHIECSAMSRYYLGNFFDIHGGGLDLIFPHHENEITQSCCAYNIQKTANVWMHNGFLQLEGKKMSKSTGNFITINDLLITNKFGGRSWSGLVLRLAMLMTHYRDPINFSIRRLEEAEQLLSKWPKIESSEEPPDPSVISPLLDDLNTVEAIKALHKLAQTANKNHKLLSIFSSSARILGLQPKEKFCDRELLDKIEELIKKRLRFLELKNFVAADHIRDTLRQKGILLKDHKDPINGQRFTTWEK